MAMEVNGDVCFSGSADSNIRVWKIPSTEHDPYSNYGRYSLNSTVTMVGIHLGGKLCQVCGNESSEWFWLASRAVHRVSQLIPDVFKSTYRMILILDGGSLADSSSA